MKASAPDAFLESARASRPFEIEGLPQATGLTESQKCLRTMSERTATGCHFTAVRVAHIVRINLPRWVNVPSEHADWERKRAAKLAAHEEGHFALHEQIAKDLYAAVIAIPPAPTCEELNNTMNKVTDEFFALARAKNAEYDKATQHGLKQPGFPE